MKLTLSLINHDPRAMPSESAKSVNGGSLRIGRGRDNDWILPDPDRHISKSHCQIDFAGDGYTLTDTSTNGVFVNQSGRPVGKGNAVPLHDGDRLRLGNYEFEVRVAEPAGQAAGDYGGDFHGGGDPFAPPPSGGGSDPFDTGRHGQGDQFAQDNFGNAGFGDDGFGDQFGDDFADGGFPGMPPRQGGPGGGAESPDRDPFATGQPFGPQGGGQGGDAGDPFGGDPFAAPPGGQSGSAGGRGGGDRFEDDLFGPPAEGPRAVERGPGEEADPFGIGEGAEGAHYDPFAEDDTPKRRIDADDPFAGPPPARRDEGYGGPPAGGAGGPGPVIPDDFDPLADDLGKEDWSGPSEADHIPAEQEFFRVPGSTPESAPPGGQQIPDDWDLPEESAPPPSGGQAPQPPRPPQPPPPMQPPQPPQTPQGPPSRQRGAAPPEPPPQRQAPPPRQAPPVQPPTAGPPASGDPVEAFLIGAGINPNELPPERAAEMMQLFGTLFRDMVGGLCEVLQVRRDIKERFQMAERTQLRRSENNPLKFSINADDALANLITRPRPGFLPADRAVREAMDDIKAHELAVMAGMQVALKALLDRFDPDNLEKRIEQSSVWDNILPGNRKAKYWELFREHYREIAREAEDDFHGLFGREFSRAYERQAKQV
jgi:type VI secretion system FHA domain protein